MRKSYILYVSIHLLVDATLKRLKVGMLGCGGMAGNHATRLSTMKEVEFSAFCDIVEDKAKVFSAKYGGKVYTNWREMFDREKLDVVYVCLPPFAHGDEVMIAAERGIHVFIEKPIALSMDIAKRMMEAVKRCDVRSQVGYNCRFAFGVDKAKQLIESGEAGHVGLSLGWYWCHFLGGAWWRDERKSGGQIVEQATHLYDTFRYLCGDVDRVYGEMDRRFWVEVPDLSVEDVSSSTFRFKSGAIGAIVSTTWGTVGQWWLRWLIATKNYTLESSGKDTLTWYTTKAPAKTQTVSEQRDTYLLESQNLIRAILKDGETRTPMTEGAKTLEFTLAARKSMKTGRTVKLPLR